MALISTHEGIFKWLIANNIIGKKRHNKKLVDIIVKEYKKETDNNLHYFNFYPNKTSGKKWEQSKMEFKQFIEWAKSKYLK